MDLVQKVKETIEQERLIKEGDKVLLGASGGIDSTALLFVLLEIRKTLPFDLGLAHINHALRGEESDRDEQFVASLAARLSLPIHINKTDAKRFAHEAGLSLQHAGREIRYKYFDDVAADHGYNRIVVAHNLDDQVETFLLRAIKGTGIKGLSAIPIMRGRIVRPFLHTYRAQIEEYARRNSIFHVEDSSNEKTTYERNYLRKEIFPLLEKLNPACKEKLFHLLQDITGINRFFTERSRIFLARHRKINKEGVVLRLDSLINLDEETKFRVISETIVSLEPQFILLREHYRQIQHLVDAQKPNLSCTLPHGLRVRRTYGDLVFSNRPFPSEMRDILPVSLGANRLDDLSHTFYLSRSQRLPMDFPDNHGIAFFDSDKLGDLTVRTFRNGDRFVPLGMNCLVKLKDFFISRKIPREERRTIPLLLSDNDIIWVVGNRIDDRYKISEQTRKVLKVRAIRHSAARRQSRLVEHSR